ncbi:MAG: hypothetical protein ACKOYJ_09205 [Planctomycetia bacterium]
MEIWSEIRREVLTGALSKRAAIATYKVGWHTLKKMLANDEPPGYRQAKQRPKPKLDAFLPVLRQMLEDDGKAASHSIHSPSPLGEQSSAVASHRLFCECRPDAKLVDGEAAAIGLALETQAKTLLIDERDGTRIARGLGIATAGTLVSLNFASAKNLLSLEQSFAALAQTSFRVRPSLLTALLVHEQHRRPQGE